MCVFFFKQKTAYEMRISDWSSDVCSSDLLSPEQTRIVVVLAALPTAQNAFLFSQRYGVGVLIARDTIFVTTLGCIPVLFLAAALLPCPASPPHPIGRASCRERVCQYV